MSGTGIWQGIDYEWRQEPHRLNRMGSVLNFDLQEPAPDSGIPLGGPIKGVCTSNFFPGAFKDKGDVRTFISNLADRNLSFVHGEVGVTLFGEVGTSQQKSATRQVVQLPIREGVAAAVLRGFDIACTDPAPGVSTRGFGFELLDPQVTATAISFVPRFFIFPENSPDRRAKRYTYDMTLHYTVVCGRGDSVHITEATEPVTVSYSGPTKNPRLANGEITGLANTFPFGVLGIRGLRFTLDRDNKRTKRDGRYLRRLRFFVGNFQYDRATGAMDFRTHVLFSNKGPLLGPFATAYHVVHELFPTLIQHNGVEPEQIMVENTIKTASTPTLSTGFELKGLPVVPRGPTPVKPGIPRKQKAVSAK